MSGIAASIYYLTPPFSLWCRNWVTFVVIRIHLKVYRMVIFRASRYSHLDDWRGSVSLLISLFFCPYKDMFNKYHGLNMGRSGGRKWLGNWERSKKSEYMKRKKIKIDNVGRERRNRKNKRWNAIKNYKNKNGAINK